MQLLNIYGPGGIGKSTLLQEFLSVCQERGIPAALIDGRNLDPTPPGAAGGFTPQAQETRILLIDTYEQLGALDGWLRNSLLPALSASTLVVLPGRYAPAQGWRSDPGWLALRGCSRFAT